MLIAYRENQWGVKLTFLWIDNDKEMVVDQVRDIF